MVVKYKNQQKDGIFCSIKASFHLRILLSTYLHISYWKKKKYSSVHYYSESIFSLLFSLLENVLKNYRELRIKCWQWLKMWRSGLWERLHTPKGVLTWSWFSLMAKLLKTFVQSSWPLTAHFLSPCSRFLLPQVCQCNCFMSVLETRSLKTLI